MMLEDGVYPKFFKKGALHEGKSKEAGRQVYVDRDYVEIRVPGMDKQVHIAPANSTHKARFPLAWAAYEKGAEAPKEGTPLHVWPRMTPSSVSMLEALNIHTVEDMANAPDFALQKIGMGAREWQREALKFLSLAQTSADVGQLDELREQNAALQAKLAALTAQVEALAPKPKEAEPTPEQQQEPPRRRKQAA